MSRFPRSFSALSVDNVSLACGKSLQASARVIGSSSSTASAVIVLLNQTRITLFELSFSTVFVQTRRCLLHCVEARSGSGHAKPNGRSARPKPCGHQCAWAVASCRPEPIHRICRAKRPRTCSIPASKDLGAALGGLPIGVYVACYGVVVLHGARHASSAFGEASTMA